MIYLPEQMKSLPSGTTDIDKSDKLAEHGNNGWVWFPGGGVGNGAKVRSKYIKKIEQFSDKVE